MRSAEAARLVVGRRAAIIALVVCVAAGCGSSTEIDDPVSLDDALASREVVRVQGREVIAIVADQGLDLVGASGSWTSCTDDGYEQQYNVSGALDAGAPVSEGLFDDVRDAVAGGTAWKPAMMDGSRLVEARGPLGGSSVSISAEMDHEVLLVELFGPCMVVAEEDRDSLDQGDVGAQELEIPGAE